MLFQLSVPVENERGPQYLEAALAAVHRAFQRQQTCQFLLAKHDAHVGLFCRADAKQAPVLTGQLLAAYPDLRIERIDETAFEQRQGEFCYWARLRLAPGLAPLLSAEHFVDREGRRLADPLAALLGAIASGKTRKKRGRLCHRYRWRCGA